MKATTLLYFPFLLIAGTSLHAQSGGPWAIASGTISGGGGRSTGGAWTLTGTIGQPDASTHGASAGTWQVTGGYWPAVSLSEPLGLFMARADDTHVRVSWPASAAGYQLQFSQTLITWSDHPAAITGAGSVLFQTDQGRLYIRLTKLP